MHTEFKNTNARRNRPFHGVGALAHRLGLGVACLLISAGAVRADTVRRVDGGVVEGTITAIDAEFIVVGSNRLARQDVSLLSWAGPDLLESPAGLVLAEGTLLHGVLHRVTPQAVVFRSAALGKLDIAMADIAGFFFGGNDGLPLDDQPPVGQVQVHLQNGTKLAGTLFAITPTRVVIRAHEGLQQIDPRNVRYIAARPVRARPPATLRNGDQLTMSGQWQGGAYHLAVGTNAPAAIPLQAFKQWMMEKK